MPIDLSKDKQKSHTTVTKYTNPQCLVKQAHKIEFIML